MQMRFLGINGFEFKAQGKTLLIDPYLSRDRDLVCIPEVVRKHVPVADYIFLGHSHWDHAADVPEIARYTDAAIFGSETMLHICRHFGVAETRLHLLEPHQRIELGAFSVTPFKSLHKEPVGYPGRYFQPPERIAGACDYLEGGSWALLVECGGYSFLNLGSANLIDAEIEGIRCDFLLAGIAGRAPDYLPRLLRCVKAETLIPTHWDDFVTRPVEDPGERISVAAFYAEMEQVAPAQNVKLVQPLETWELPDRPLA